MENREFRDRLKNHTTDSNPAAWEQMQSLLDSVPEVQKEDKDKKRGFWLFFFGMGFIALLGITWLLIDTSSNAEMNEVLSTNETVLESKSQEKKIDFYETGVTKEAADGSFSKEENQQIDHNYNEKEIPKYDSISKSSNKKNQYDSGLVQQVEILKIKTNDTNHKKNFGDRKINKIMRENGSIEFSSSFYNDSLIVKKQMLNNISDAIDSSITKNESGQEFEQQMKNDKANLSKPENTDASNVNVIESIVTNDRVDSRGALLSINRLMLPLKEIAKGKGERSVSPLQVKIIKPSRFSIFGGVGYAWFNENPGFIINGGVYYDVDRILDLEANIGYVYGSEQNVLEGEKFTFEKEVELSLLIHLNLVKNRMHKLSLIAGIGYSFYSGERVRRWTEPVTVDIRSSTGRNFQGAINYRIRINQNYSIGMSGGFISYDDIIFYITPRFIYDF